MASRESDKSEILLNGCHFYTFIWRQVCVKITKILIKSKQRKQSFKKDAGMY